MNKIISFSISVSPYEDIEKKKVEEKCIGYIEHLIKQENNFKIKNNIFLKRNFKKIKNQNKNVFFKNGLEIKVCIATFKIFFVENTEDVFFRLKNKK
jgi:histone deacetylase complex regulatory component SIN3